MHFPGAVEQEKGTKKEEEAAEGQSRGLVCVCVRVGGGGCYRRGPQVNKGKNRNPSFPLIGGICGEKKQFHTTIIFTFFGLT